MDEDDEDERSELAPKPRVRVVGSRLIHPFGLRRPYAT